MAAHSSILAWRIQWTEEPGGPQSPGSQRGEHDLSDIAHTHTANGSFFFRRKPGMLSPWNCEDLDTT